MAIAYSIRIFSHASLTPSAGTVGPVVPAGHIYVLRCVDVFEVDAVNGANMAIVNALGGTLRIFAAAVDANTRSFQWQGRQVYQEGEQVGFRINTGTWSIMASGYRLSLT